MNPAQAPPYRLVIAGGSGFLGLSFATFVGSGEYRHDPARSPDIVLLSRKPPRSRGPWRHVPWDGQTLGPWAAELDGADALVNLAGRSVDCIKTPDHQDEILRSRVLATRVLGIAVRCCAAPPQVWVQMSTAHIYGDPPTTICDEDAPLGYGFAPFVGQAWEREFAAAALPTQRTIVLRTGFVLGRERGGSGGALARLRWIARLGLGGAIGGGTQGMSWIHERDMNRVIWRAITDPSMQGVYVASAPRPVGQREFMRTLRRVLRVPIGLPATEWMVRLGAHWLLRTDPELVLYGRYVVSRRLRDAGFEFDFPELEGALRDLLGPT